ncbi:MAG: hypothetical protein U1F18_02595 [Steroidobacteraceae bacterium]|jgi:hypothetical protein
MKNQLPLCAAVILALAGATAAVAEERGALLDAVRQFERADFDGNKTLSWEEFRNYVLQMFHAADHDGNGIIQGDEHPPAKTRDGKPAQPKDVTIDAFNAEVRRLFQKADVDKSGDLSWAEYAGDGPAKEKADGKAK